MHYSERLTVCDFKSLQHKRTYNDVVLIYRIVRGLCALNLSDIDISPVQYNYNLRCIRLFIKINLSP